MGIDLNLTMYFFTLAEAVKLSLQYPIRFFSRGHPRNQSKNIPDEYYIAFFLSGD